MVAMVPVMSVLYCVVVVCCGDRIPSDPMLLIVIPQSEGDCKSISDALEANHCLRSLHVHFFIGSSYELSVMIGSLCRNERLTELTIDIEDLIGMYRVSDM